jgi:hypothetical protein
VSEYFFDKLANDHRTERRHRLGIEVDETTSICPVCADVDCMEHADNVEATPGELAMAEVRRMAPVVAAARSCLDAWDVSENVPPRIRMALSDLSDALAKMDQIPF